MEVCCHGMELVALLMALSMSEGEVECINATHKDADLWIQVWDKVSAHKEQDLKLGSRVGQRVHCSKRQGADDASEQANCV